jgi:hypothetical protein
VKYWEIIADNLSEAGGAWAGFQPWILADAPSLLQTRIAVTESVSLCVDEKLTAFLEL